MWQQWRAGKVHDLSIVLIISLFSLLLFFIGWSRHHGFLTSINDMGHYDQAIWGVLKKGYFLNSSQFNIPINKLGFHFDPILFLFAPLYFIEPTVSWLILAQSLAIAISAWPIYLLARHLTNSPGAGVLWALAYLVNPFLLNAATWDFHPLTLAVPFVGLGALAIEKSRFKILLVSCLIILLCKEHFGLMVAGFGLLWAIRHREYAKPAFLVCLGSIHFILVFKFIMPFFSPTGGHVMLSNDMGQLSRYAWLGKSVTEILQTILQHPINIIKTVIAIGGLSYVLLLLLPFFGLPIWGGAFLIPAMGDLAANILSANPMPRAMFAYHSAAITPLVCIAAIKGSLAMKFLQRHLSHAQIAGIVLLASLIFGYVFTVLPLPYSLNFWAPSHLFSRKDPRITVMQDLIGPASSISVQANVGAHFSQREKIYTFPHQIGDADFIVLRLESPTTKIFPENLSQIATLSSHLQIKSGDFLHTTEKLIMENMYGIFYWNDPWLILKKNQRDIYQEEIVLDKLTYLKNEWIK